ncbi:MAG: PIN domain-containing protein [Hyphomonadaceae bacterium]|nr:PIN domain-containing protein [Hyphomonadaceae bacterium]
MIRASLDSNILIYAALEPQTAKGKAAADLIARVAPRGVIANQALLEFVAVVQRRAPSLVGQAIRQVDLWSKAFETAATNDRVVAEGLEMMSQHHFQVWDAIIWAAARQAGASVFFTEDLQDGFAKDGMRACNPFVRDAAALQAIVGA